MLASMPRWLGYPSEAERRGVALLLSCLTEEQRVQFYRDAQVEVRGRSGLRYRLLWRASGGVAYLGSDGLWHSLCVVAASPGLPLADIVLAQLLMIRCEEREFWKLARVVGAPVFADLPRP